MKLSKRNMTKEDALHILDWEYEAPYEIYNQERAEENLAEFLNGTYFSLVDDQNRLFGYYCSGVSAQVPAGNKYGVYEGDAIDMGLGMNPVYTGNGHGLDFVVAILDELELRYGDYMIRLSVAKFNTRAIHLYEKVGFSKEAEFTNGITQFITMTRHQ
ncbi:GNAT family N-acetyltransferase [Halobacillus salinus]|uniref:GNAT family N-acetyltransferase n=1 Tax=Halobacillus salinus TaxID=192814 RepID=UPI0009A806C4|nr:GNAT family protein [Halobacillus salinus]